MKYTSGSALLLVSAVAVLASSPTLAAQAQDDSKNLSNLSIEELAQIPVRSASKTEEPLSAVPNALYVITADDVARSNATSLPEALRLAPNLWVQRANAREFAISARGFNGVDISNKLLVLVDGRSIYSTLHSGVFWELHSPIPEDLARIEVISGPGGTLYGPNAVNGVVSISTRDARETLGVSAHGTASGDERTAGARLGFSLGQSGAMRVYGNWFDREGLSPSSTPTSGDGIRGWEAGARADLGSDANHLMVKAEAFDNMTFLAPGDGNNGQNVTARWNRALSDTSALQLQAYFDVFHRRSRMTEDFLQTVDGEAQFNIALGDHQLVAGIGARHSRDRFINALNTFRLVPDSAERWLINGFVQDRFAITPQFSIVAGLKVEHSSFTGIQLLPNLRLAWQPSENALVWAAISRAVRTPSRVDRDLIVPFRLVAAPDIASEKLLAFELGYRDQIGRNTSFSINAFFQGYDDLRTVDSIGTGRFPQQLRNDSQGHSFGVEAWGNQQLMPWWRVSAGAAWLVKRFHLTPGTHDITAGAAQGRDPDLQLSLRSQMNLPLGFTIDTALRHVDAVSFAPAIPGYTEADARLGWRANAHIELFVAGDNLLHASHLESNEVSRNQPILRTVSGGARIRF